MTEAADGAGGGSAITYAEIHSELEEVRRILVDLTGTVERLSSIVASDSSQHGAPVPATSIPAPEAVPSSPSAPNPVDAILGDTFGRPA